VGLSRAIRAAAQPAARCVVLLMVDPMAEATLTITGKGQTREVPLGPKGIVLGRSSACDVVLDSALVSRQHARVFQDPFGRWIIEDLQSRIGVVVGGQRVRAHALLPGERAVLGPFVLSLSEPIHEEIAPDSAGSTTTGLIDAAADMEVTQVGVTSGAALSRERLRELNRIVDSLESLTSPGQLYPAVCRCLAGMANTVALVVRLPKSSLPLPPSPQVLASHLAAESGAASAAGAENVYLSRRVLEAVRSSREPVMARSAHLAETELSLTLVDERRSRAVVCAPVGEQPASIDALYLDMPLDLAAADMLDYVHAVARQVRLVRRSLLLTEVRAQRRVLDYQLGLAREIQSRLMPAALSSVPGVDVAFYYEPAMWVGGDYCDVWPLSDGRLALAVGDVAGKGLPAALVMASIHAALRATMSYCTRLDEVSQHLADHLREHMPEGMFVTLVLGILDAARARFEYVNAGHIPPFVVERDGSVLSLEEAHYMPLGIPGGQIEVATAGLTPGSSLVIVTDGITETRSPEGQMYGIAALRDLLAKTRSASSQHLVAEITQAASDFRQTLPQQDDVTVLALACRNSRLAGGN